MLPGQAIHPTRLQYSSFYKSLARLFCVAKSEGKYNLIELDKSADFEKHAGANVKWAIVDFYAE